MNRRLLACAVALATTASLASCGSDSKSAPTVATTAPATTAPVGPVAPVGDTTPVATTPNPPACAPLQAISQYDIESTAKVATNDFSTLAQFLIDSTPAVLTAYDETAAAEPNLADDIAILRKVSEGARDAAYEATDMSTLQTLLLDIPEIQQAGPAAIALNDYATKNCGFSTGNN